MEASSSIILKILSGLQAGVEVALTEGEYRLGSSSDDDIQIIDVTLKPGHVKLRLSGRKIEIAGGTGVLSGQSGLSLPVDGDYQEIEPLDVMTAGTTRFALGLASANWASIGDATEPSRQPPRSQPSGTEMPGLRRGFTWVLSRGFSVLSALVFVVGLGLVLTNTEVAKQVSAVATPADELAVVRAALDSVPFGKDIKARQEVDGALYVDGYVNTAAERRALNQLVEKTGVPARMRLRVLETMKGEVANMISARALPISFELDKDGTLDLSGVILDQKVADGIVSLLGDEIIGISRVNSQIKTAGTLLKDVTNLAKVSKIDPYVLFRLDGTLIEVSGVIPAEKVDSWVGFLQAYAERFAKDVALRSYVQLQNVDGTLQMPEPGTPVASGPGITIGKVADGAPNIPLNVERLKDGSYDLQDVFVGDAAGSSKPGERPAAPEGSTMTALAPVNGSAAAATADNPIDLLRQPAENGAVAAGAAATGKDAPVAPVDVAVAVSSKVGDPLAMLSDDSPVSSETKTVSGSGDVTSTPATVDVPQTGNAALSGNDASPTGGQVTNSPKPASVRDPASVASAPADRNGGLSSTSQKVNPPASAGQATVADPVASEKTQADGMATPPIEAPATPSPSQSTSTDVPSETRVAAAANGGSLDEMAAMADRLIKLWSQQESEKAPVPGKEERPTAQALPGGVGLASAVEQYSPLFALSRSIRGEATNQCWPGAALTTDRLAHALFWLDLLSVDSRLTIASFKDETRLILLEAALNPVKTAACARNAFKGTAIRSVYMAEVSRNPGFIRYIVRDLPPFDMAVTGAMVATNDRYVLTGDGRKLFEGAAPTGATRVVVVGELGVVVQMTSGLATRLYDDNITWIIQ